MSFSGIHKVESKNYSSSGVLSLWVPEVCDATPEMAIDKSSFFITLCHKLEDPDFHVPKIIDLLIGSNYNYLGKYYASEDSNWVPLVLYCIRINSDGW